MRKFPATLLALSLLFFGTMALSHVPRRIKVHEVKIERIANMTSSESNDSNAIEVNGIRFETLLPVLMVRLPKYGEETPVQFGVRITNQASTPYRFDLQRFLPEFLDSKGQLIKVGINRNTSTEAEESDIPLIAPGQSLEFLMNPKLVWYRDYLRLLGNAFYGGVWELYILKSEKYQVRLRYENQLAKKKMILFAKGRDEIDGFWIGKVATPFAHIHLS